MRFDDAFLDQLRAVGDPSVDGLVEELARSGEIRVVSRVLRHLVDNDQPVPAELPPPIADWLEGNSAVPAWVDHERLERSCRMVVEHGPQACLALSTASFVFCTPAIGRQGAHVQPPARPGRLPPRRRGRPVPARGHSARIARRRRPRGPQDPEGAAPARLDPT